MSATAIQKSISSQTVTPAQAWPKASSVDTGLQKIALETLKKYDKATQLRGSIVYYNSRQYHVRFSKKYPGKLSITALDEGKKVGQGTFTTVLSCPKISSPGRSRAWLQPRRQDYRGQQQMLNGYFVQKRLDEAARQQFEKTGKRPAGIAKTTVPLVDSLDSLQGFLDELYEGDGVAILQKRKLSPADRLHAAEQILKGWGFMVKNGCVCADRKPSNTLWRKQGNKWEVILSDFDGSCFDGELLPIDLLLYTCSTRYSAVADVRSMLGLQDAVTKDPKLGKAMERILDRHNYHRDYSAEQDDLIFRMKGDKELLARYAKFAAVAYANRMHHGTLAIAVTASLVLSGCYPCGLVDKTEFTGGAYLAPEIYKHEGYGENLIMHPSVIKTCVDMYGDKAALGIAKVLSKMLHPIPKKRIGIAQALKEWAGVKAAWASAESDKDS